MRRHFEEILFFFNVDEPFYWDFLIQHYYEKVCWEIVIPIFWWDILMTQYAGSYTTTDLTLHQILHYTRYNYAQSLSLQKCPCYVTWEMLCQFSNTCTEWAAVLSCALQYILAKDVKVQGIQNNVALYWPNFQINLLLKYKVVIASLHYIKPKMRLSLALNLYCIKCNIKYNIVTGIEPSARDPENFDKLSNLYYIF